MIVEIAVVPGKTAFGLDQLRRSYKTDSTAEAAALPPAIGTADGAFPFMFLVRVDVNETAESSTQVDLTFAGIMRVDSGSPVLPASQTTDDDSVMSATSSKNLLGQTAASPFTLQFYAPTSNLTWITYNAKGDKSTVADPTDAPTIITLTIGDNAFTGTSFDVPAMVANFFTLQTTATISCQEIVPGGKYWLNRGKKINHYVPYTTSLPPGFYPSPYAGGSGYTIGDTISINSGGICTMTVQNVFNGQILGTTIVSNALSIATSTPINATGGTGSGAQYTVIHLT